MSIGASTSIVESMSVRPNVIVFAVSALLVGLIGVWFLNNFARVPVHKDTGFQKPARVNRLLAAELLIERLGQSASSLDALKQLPPVETTLILPVSRRQWSPERSSELVAWVRSGGHLITVAEPVDEEGVNDMLLQHFGVQAQRVEDAEDEFVLVSVPLSAGERALRVSFNTERRLLSEHQPLAASETGTHAVSFTAGRGRLSVLSDYRWLTNSYLSEYDHGALLWYLVSLTRYQQVWIVYRNPPVSLWWLIYESAWPVVISLGVIGMLLLWAASRRFGPLLPDTRAPRRRLLEHIDASGRFLWRHGNAMSLVEDSRRSLLRTLELRHPGWTEADDLVPRLSKLTGVGTAVVERVLSRTSVKNEDEFVNIIRVLEIMRNKL